MKERWRIRGGYLRVRTSLCVESVFPSILRFLQARLRQLPVGISRAYRLRAARGRLDGRDHARTGVVGALVVEQGVEVGALERVDQRDDLVGLEVVVMVEGSVGDVAVRSGGLAAPRRGALRRRLGAARPRADGRLRRGGLGRRGGGGGGGPAPPPPPLL